MQNNERMDTTKDNQPSIDCLIDYYTTLVDANNMFADIQFGDDNYRYGDLIKRMLSVKQLIINKDLSNVNNIYKPTEALFNRKEHFTILEETIKFYRQNPTVEYPLYVTNSNTDTTKEKDFVAKDNSFFNEQITNSIEQALSTLSDKIKIQLSDIKEPIKQLIKDEFNDVIAKASGDTLAALTTSNTLIRSDIAKYDALLTDHISKSGINAVQAIEKEHIRFVQKIESDSNQIINNVSEAINSELTNQTNMVNDSLNKFDDKAFKRAALIFFGCVFVLFACSILSSTWTASKILSGTRLVQITTVQLKPPASNLKKARHQ